MSASSYVSESPHEFYIFHEVSSAFFHIIERSDWKISVLPYDKLQEQVEAAYLSCGAAHAQPPNLPSPSEINAMTQVMRWGQELVSQTKFQLEFYFNPQLKNTSFVGCFDNNMTDWVDNFNKKQQQSDNAALIGILSFLGAAALLTIGACVLYHLWKKSNSFSDNESGIFRHRQREGESTLGAESQNPGRFENTFYNQL